MKKQMIKLSTILEIAIGKSVANKHIKHLQESLTKKDFIEMARYIKSAPKTAQQELLKFAISISKQDNPRFDEDRFRHAALGEVSAPKCSKDGSTMQQHIAGSPSFGKSEKMVWWCPKCGSEKKINEDATLGEDAGDPGTFPEVSHECQDCGKQIPKWEKLCKQCSKEKVSMGEELTPAQEKEDRERKKDFERKVKTEAVENPYYWLHITGRRPNDKQAMQMSKAQGNISFNESGSSVSYMNDWYSDASEERIKKFAKALKSILPSAKIEVGKSESQKKNESVLKEDYKPGDRVTWKNYGKDETGKIARIGKSGSIVFVQPDNSNRERWMHMSSISKAGVKEQTGDEELEWNDHDKDYLERLHKHEQEQRDRADYEREMHQGPRIKEAIGKTVDQSENTRKEKLRKSRLKEADTKRKVRTPGSVWQVTHKQPTDSLTSGGSMYVQWAGKNKAGTTRIYNSKQSATKWATGNTR